MLLEKKFYYKVAHNLILNNFVIENFSLKPLVFKIQGLVTDGHTDGRTDGRTDRPSYRDARTHLKREKTKKKKIEQEEKSKRIKMKKRGGKMK